MRCFRIDRFKKDMMYDWQCFCFSLFHFVCCVRFSYDVIYLCMLLWHDCAFITNKVLTLIMGVRICYVLLKSSSYPLHSTADVYFIMMIVLNHIQKEAGFGVSQQAIYVQAVSISSMDTLQVVVLLDQINRLFDDIITSFFLQNRF